MPFTVLEAITLVKMALANVFTHNRSWNTRCVPLMAQVQSVALLPIRSEPLMLFKLPIMLLSNAPKISLLCPSYAPLCPIMLHYAP